MRKALTDQGFRCCFVDLQALPPNLTFRDLLRWFAWTISKGLGQTLTPPPEGGQDSLEDWLTGVVAPGAPLVILIDEASAIGDEHIRNSFYGQIRAIKSSAAVNSDSVSALLVFLFAGTFRPEILVDQKNSPFNVCRRVDTEDLGHRDVIALTKATFGRDDVEAIAEAIFLGVGGQPHLVQSLLAVAEAHDPEDAVASVQSELDRLSIQANDHSDSIFRAVVAETALTEIAITAVTHGKIPNDPANDYYRYMIVLGLMRRDGIYLVFRNPLYEKIARGSPQLQPSGTSAQPFASHFYRQEIAYFAFIADATLREICCAAYNSAVVAWNARSYRSTLIGFGVALEALLIDLLLQQKVADIAAAIAAAAAAKQKLSFGRHEDPTDPETWRLVNLIAVAKLLKRKTGPLEVPEALREMRNFVHPAVLRKAYRPEHELAPEALAAGGLTAMVIRDIQGP
jgi:hypothetical protein